MKHLTIATSSGIVWLMLVCHFGAALIALVAGTIALSTDLGGEWMMLPIGSPVEHKTCRAERAANAYSIVRTGVAPIPALSSTTDVARGARRAYFRPSFLPAASSAIDSRMRRARVSGRFAMWIQTTKLRRSVRGSF